MPPSILKSFLLLLPLMLISAKPPLTLSLSGAIDKYPVHMDLTIVADGTVTGSYFYLKQKKPIKLTGTFSADDDAARRGAFSGAIELTETDPSGKITGTFDGSLSAARAIRGTWKPAGKGKDLNFVVREDKPARLAAGWPAPGEFNASASTWDTGTLDVGGADGKGFGFALEVMSGSHSGAVDGRAVYEGGRAVFRDKEHNCTLTFSPTRDGIRVEQDGCEGWYAGAGVYFAGEYSSGSAPPADDCKKSRTCFADSGMLTPEQERAFASLVGSNYATFADSYQFTNEGEDRDGKGARVYTGAVRGLYTIVEAVIMVTPDGRIWAAVIDGDVVRYFTNVPEDRRKLPRTIEAWRENFSEKKVVFTE